MNIIIEEPVLVFSPPVNEATKKWGVYAIPKMWRNATGEFVVRFNGEEDSGLTTQQVPNLYFTSTDEGRSWKQIFNGDEVYDTSYFSGINPLFTKLRNGDILAVRHREDLPPIPDDIPYQSEFKDANGSMIFHTYQYGDIPDACVDIDLFRKHGEDVSFSKIRLDFPERILTIQAKGYDDAAKDYIPVPLKVQNNIFMTPFISAITELRDGTLAAVAHGQHPQVYDRLCEEAYLLVSLDGGITWRKRSTIASDSTRKFGCVGDGGEISLTQSSNGNLICAMRTDMSIRDCTYDTLVCVSEDNGFTWSKPTPVADSSVTPHVVALQDGCVILVYGRPGVHFVVSEDNGYTWSKPFSIIGRTLSEELAEGKDIMEVKYFDSISYSNTFVEKISEDTILVLYNNQKYDDGDGQCHKAAFVRKIKISR